MANATVPQETEYRVLSQQGNGAWHVVATGFYGLLGTSLWVFDAYSETYRPLRVERRLGGTSSWGHVYSIIPGGEVVA